MSWASIKMTQQEAMGTSTDFVDAFEKLFIAAKKPRDAALFCSRELGPDDAFFLSPGAQKIATSLLALRPTTKCKAPSKKDVILLAGHDDGIALLR